ncbi:MAG: Gfo/Idh/MocA family oxidoreductase [Bacteroidota bacterium]
MKKSTRRSFIKKTTLATAGISLAGTAFSASSYRRIMGANDRINIAVVGTNRRANGFRNSFAVLKERVNVLYVSDVIKERRDSYAASLKEHVGYIPKAVNDFRKILDKKKVDAIFNLTPDHWHAPGTWMALEAGKHVYVEKPLTHNPRESELLLEARKKYNKVVQMGNQQRSQITARKIIKEIHEGIIGEPYKAVAFYSNARGSIGNGKLVPVPDGFDWDLFQGPAPRVAYKDIYFDYNWHWFWQWGTGETGNNATHELDVARWALQVGNPEEVLVDAGKYHYIDDDWTMYDTMEATFKYPGGKVIKWDGKSRTSYNTYGMGRGDIIYGTKGTVLLNRNDVRVFDLKGKEIKHEKEATQSQTTALGGGGGISTYHVANFFDAILGKAEQNSELNEAVDSTLLIHLANISSRTNSNLKINPTSGHILDDEIMKKYWGRVYERGWEPPKF